jgi:2-methylisocitrate lyase-like PEP mutase family enzyme
LYAPGLTRKEDIATVLKSVDRPLNVLMALQGSELDLQTLSAMGVRRVSVGSALCRAALGAFLRAAREMREHGTFTYAAAAVKFKDISELLKA